MKRTWAHRFRPGYGWDESTLLKHWHGKRVKWRGKYAKIVAAKLDRDMNFTGWQILVNGNIHDLNDPNYVYSA